MKTLKSVLIIVRMKVIIGYMNIRTNSCRLSRLDWFLHRVTSSNLLLNSLYDIGMTWLGSLIWSGL